jgi:hypothetical protein
MLMTAPYVERTTKQIEAEQDRLTRSLLRAELACYWARVGEFSRAEDLRVNLRAEFGDGKSPRVSIMIMCLEGLLLYFRDLDHRAKDRLDRANLLAGAIRDDSLVAITSAWQAHVAFNQDQFDSMGRYADACLAAATERNLQALSRITLVMGDLFAYAANRSVSQAWYGAARDIALRLGDHASLGAITYNRAALRVFNFRLQDVEERVLSGELDILDAEVRSAINYQSLAELRSLDHLLSSAHVGSLVLRGEFGAALREAQAVMSAGSVRAGTAQHTLLLADAAHCALKVNDRSLSERLLLECEGYPLDGYRADDLALIYAQLGVVVSGLGLQNGKPHYGEMARETLRQHLADRQTLCEQNQRFESLPEVVRRACLPA